MRVAVVVLGAQPDALEQLLHAQLRVLSRPWIANGSPMIWPTVLRGFSDEYGSWKIICISRRSGRSWRCESLRDVAAVEADRPGGRVEQAHDQPRRRRLAAARLADDAERLAAVEPSATRPRPRAPAPLPRANTPCLTAKRLVRCSSSTRLLVRSPLRAHAAAPHLGAIGAADLAASCSHGRWQASRWRVRRRCNERRALRSARLEAVPAARMERAAGRRVRAATAASPRSGRARRGACSIDRHRLEQAPRVRVLRPRRRSRSPARTP